jgi:hypothetical protein
MLIFNFDKHWIFFIRPGKAVKFWVTLSIEV